MIGVGGSLFGCFGLFASDGAEGRENERIDAAAAAQEIAGFLFDFFDGGWWKSIGGVWGVGELNGFAALGSVVSVGGILGAAGS